MANIENEPKTKARVAVKTYVDASGNKAEIESATGITYKALGQEGVFTYQIPGAVAGSEQTMLALFGATTKATNVRSTAYQLRDEVADPAADMAAVNDWFAGLGFGVWPEGRGATGPRFDLDILAQAWAQVLKDAGKKPGKVEALATRLSENADLYKQVRTNGKVLAAYYTLAGASDEAAIPE